MNPQKTRRQILEEMDLKNVSSVLAFEVSKELAALRLEELRLPHFKQAPPYVSTRDVSPEFREIEHKLSNLGRFGWDFDNVAKDSHYFTAIVELYRRMLAAGSSAIKALADDLSDSNLVVRINRFLTENLSHTPLSRDEIQKILSSLEYQVATTYLVNPHELAARMDEVCELRSDLSPYFKNLMANLAQAKIAFNNGEVLFSADAFITACENSAACFGPPEVTVGHWTFSESFIPELLIFGLKPKSLISG